jgi:hypothetical protein
MSVEVQWTDTDPTTGERRFVFAERFARQWTFKVRLKRRENWRVVNTPTRQMWEDLLESLELRFQRREGVEEAELVAIRKILAAMPDEAADE